MEQMQNAGRRSALNSDGVQSSIEGSELSGNQRKMQKAPRIVGCAGLFVI
jgi:hypothetical protein